MTGIKVLGLAAVVEGVSAAHSLPIEVYEKLGFVGLLIAAVVAIYRDSKADKAELKILLERAIATIEHNTIVIDKCKGKQ